MILFKKTDQDFIFDTGIPKKIKEKDFFLFKSISNVLNELEDQLYKYINDL